MSEQYKNINNIKLPIPDYSKMSTFASFNSTANVATEKSYTINNNGFYDIRLKNNAQTAYYHITTVTLNNKELFMQSMPESGYFETYLPQLYLRKNDVLKIKVSSNGSIATTIRYCPLL